LSEVRRITPLTLHHFLVSDGFLTVHA
jgi:hypothetical protein